MENDYYNTFFNHLAFYNIIATSFLRRYSSIFIGCSMQDINIRRILYQLQTEKIASSDIKEHFALIPSESIEEDKFIDTLLKSLGVNVIRIPQKNKGREIERILKQVYISEDRMDEETWRIVRKGSWSKNK